jgi:putative spermidine/putrescine transport system substrate-binding protein
MKHKRIVACLGAISIVGLAACGSSGGSSKGPLKELGKGEGQLNIIAWPYYAENGSNGVGDWVTPFEQQTGCKVNVKIGNTSDEMVQLMKTGDYDGVSASGDATLRLISSGDVAEVNTDLVPNYKDIFDYLKMTPYNSKDGKAYGIPHGWGANVLMYNTDSVTPAPTSWSVMFDPASPYKGKISAYDNPIYIADAALYLKNTQPDLKITNPYALDDAQFKAAVDLLKQQKGLVGEYWSDYAKQEEAFTSGSLVVGTSWDSIVKALQAQNPPVKVSSTLPAEGSTAWADTWMISSKAKHPNCMYMWMNHITSPEVQAQVAVLYGEAPANQKACALTDPKTHCDDYHAADQSFYSKLAFWTTPTKQCLDGRGAKCKDYADWIKAWTEIKG